MIYLDNAATTYPKPEEVYKALDNANRNLAFNAGRGEYKQSKEAFDLIEDTRVELASLIHRNGNEVIFTSSATESLNLIINGINITEGDTVFVSPFEHNAVIRPLKNLQKIVNFDVEVLPFNKQTWKPELDKIQNVFAVKHPKAIFISHVSNVTGYVIPYEDIFALGGKWNSINVLDCSQSFGVLNPSDISNVSYLIFAGHKSLYAPFGIAGFLKLKNDSLQVVKAGGTGSDSLNPEMPLQTPYRYEAGSPNIVAIAGLHTSIQWLKKTDIKTKEIVLMDQLVEELRKIDGLVVYQPPVKNSFGVISVNLNGYSSEDLASILNEDYDICVRAGYHCAPLVHDFIDSKEFNGTVRISLNYFNDKSDIDELIHAIEEIAEE